MGGITCQSSGKPGQPGKGEGQGVCGGASPPPAGQASGVRLLPWGGARRVSVSLRLMMIIHLSALSTFRLTRNPRKGDRD